MKVIPEIFDREWELVKIILDHPKGIRMRDLVAEGKEKQGWERTTIYTMVKRMADRGAIIWDQQGTNLVFPKYTQAEYRQDKLRRMLNQVYDGDREACLEDAKRM